MKLHLLRYPALALVGAGYLLLWPAQLRIPCLVHATTGLWCPGCGGQRALTALLAGDIGSAWALNQLLVCAPAALIAALWLQKVAPRPVWISALLLIGAGVIGFTIWRNIPGNSIL